MSMAVRDGTRGLSAKAIALVALGAVIGGLLMRAPISIAEASGPSGTSVVIGRPVRAVTFGLDEVALVESGGLYFVVNARGASTPVRFRNTDLTNPPGESTLPTP